MASHEFTISTRRIALLAAVLIPACDKESPPSAVSPVPEPKAAKQMSEAEAKALASKVEAFTGAHTRIVWSQYQNEKLADPRSNKSGHLLMGIDTADGKGIRALLTKEDNYSRPLISSDGDTILYTNKLVTWDAEDTKHYAASIMRTDWSGKGPIKIADGYAVDTWVDPATQTEWVYAVQDIASSPLAAIEAAKLVRFPLSDPKRVELVWDQTKSSPDNIQLSRDGKRASGQAPSPDAGFFIFGEKREFRKLPAGSWPSVAPDNSYISWVLDEQHKNLTLFGEDASQPWSIALDTDRELMKGEVWHPCWSNHPRFITLTGPYVTEKSEKDGSAIGKGGLTSEVFIGKFSEKLDKIESWLRITDNALNDNYPDVWIAGGDKAELADFPQIHDAKIIAASNWPSSREALLFLWENRDASNQVKLPNDRRIDCQLDLHGAARYGRSLEMLLDGGTFGPNADASGIISDALQSAMPLSVEFVLHIEGEVKSAFGTLATFPHLRMTLRDGVISAETSAGIIGIGPIQGSVSHVTAFAGDTGYSVTLTEADGKSSTKISAARPRQSPVRSTVISFGGGNGKGIGMSHVAVYARKLTAEEIHEHAEVLPTLPIPTLSTTLKLRGKLVQSSPVPTAASINPDQGAFIESVYELTKIIEGEYDGKQILVKHWGMMDGKPTRGFPRKPGLEYDLVLQPFSDHPQFKDIRSMPVDGVKDLEPWYDISPPAVGR